MWDIIVKDIIPMGGEQRISLLATQTPICADDLVEKMQKDRHWRTVLYPAIISYPKNEALWDKYFDMWENELVMRTDHAKSLGFYRENFDEMNEGGEVFNPRRFCEDDGHISALQKLLETKRVIGEAAFASEYQMCPLRLQAALPITTDVVNARISSLRRLEVPKTGVRLVAASTDLNVSKYMTTTIVVFLNDGSQVCIWHDFHKTSISANVPPEEYDRQLYNALSDLGKRLQRLGVDINSWAIDGNGMAWHAVTRFANNSKAICGIPVCSFVGRASHLFRDHVMSRLKESVNRTVLCGDKDEQKKAGAGTRWIYWDSDYYREKVHKGFLQAVGNLGSLSWYNGDDHTRFSIQVCGEKLVDKVELADGATKYVWRDVAPAWDVLDSLAQALAAYGSYGFSDGTTGIKSLCKKRAFRRPKLKIV